MDTRPYTVVGVLPAAFAYPSSDIAVFVLGRYQWPDPTLRQAFASMGPPLRVLGEFIRLAAAQKREGVGDVV